MVTSEIPMAAAVLGTPTAHYAPNPRVLKINRIVSIIFLVICLGGAVPLIINWLSGEDVLILLIIALVVAGLSVWGLVDNKRKQGMQLLVFPEGLAETKQEQTSLIRWDDISYSWQSVTKHYRTGIYTGTTHLYTIQTKDGQQYKFNDTYKNVEALGNLIQDEVARRIFPVVAQAYNAGQTVNFGQLNISKAGINNGKETIAWDEVKDVKLQSGIVTIKKEGKWLNWKNVTVAQTPNIFVFLGMVNQIVGVNTAQKK
jgi:hypothetical protein